MRMRRLVALTAVGLALAACGSQQIANPGAGSDDVSRVAFLQEESTYPMALLAGTLGGDAETGCLWVSGPHGEGERTPLRLHHDSAVLDVSAQPPVIRDGDRVLAAFGDAVEMGGGFGVSPAGPSCTDHGTPFTGHSLVRALPGAPPTVTLTELRRACGPVDGPALAGSLVVDGVPRQSLVLEVDAPDGTLIARQQLPAAEGWSDLLVPLDDARIDIDLPPEWNVRVSEREQVIAQALVDLRPGPTCG